jgi:hypothetical protein
MRQTIDIAATPRRESVAVQPTKVRSGLELVLLGLESLLAVGALAGAIGMITGAVDLGDAVARLPFQSMVFAGWALALVNGVLPTLVVIGVLQRREWSRYGHFAVGASLLAWVVVQVSVLGPPIQWLQALYFAWGVAILTLAWRMHNDHQSAASTPAETSLGGKSDSSAGG